MLRLMRKMAMLMLSSVQAEPAWLAVGRAHIGTIEYAGPAHNKKILGWLAKLGAWWRDDETPWCGVYTAACLTTAQRIAIPKMYMRAKAWLDWGVRLQAPRLGCVVVFERKGGGHVGFVVGKDKAGNLLVLGGNQGNAVNIRPFAVSRVLGYRWPAEIPVPELVPLPAVASAGELSTMEA